jgi:hypothetical protein
MSPLPIWRCNEFTFNKRDLVLLAVALCAAAVVGVWVSFQIAGYLAAADPNDRSRRQAACHRLKIGQCGRSDGREGYTDGRVHEDGS